MPLIQYLSRILFDFGAADSLADEIARLGIDRPLLVTDKGVAEAGLLGRVLDAAKPFAPVVYDGTTENPTEQSLLGCMEIWRDKGCDGIIALGGGSPIDLSKAVALIASHGGRLADYDVKTGGSEKIGTVAPQIAIPTTAGTGAEVGRACVMLLGDGTKCIPVNLNMVAETVICDPELALTLPPRLTAATGMDALSHGFEATLSNVINPPAAAIALDCTARAAKWLKVAVEDGSNRQARWEMMMAALEGGMCLQKSLGAAHALAAPLGELNLHHGTLVGILLPHVLRYNAEAAPRAIERLRQAAEIPDNVAVDEWLRNLAATIGLPSKLSEIGFDPAQIENIAKKAMKDHLTAANPRRPELADYISLLKEAL